MSTTTSHSFPLATEQADPNSVESIGGNAAGAAGDSSGGVQLSQSALIAIIIVVSVVAILGIVSSILFYLAKKKEWKIRETIRRSAKKVVTALTPRRSEFPRSVKESRSGRVRLEDVPPTPRLKPSDLEKGLNVKVKSLRKDDDGSRTKRSNFSRK